ncbi:polyprenol phosphomannose-dependent alpha 1,6 mannosyltransferase MptB [Muricauda sp. DJ-13]|uniref:Polyprenol phosphomannose-dependent alpha 1,6 mannosyltransferase MptB n=1 Tax=Croceivirga thetidis TaxID=2721623 RepID=A0ABX1GRI9_9FLAO|nr:polyprenol phosphomannose-dependent alpha 1,6 mannosyltransferase MptB [Croceivirga thetidis]
MVLANLLLYTVFAYDLEREDFLKLLALYAGLFILLYKIIQFEKWNFKFLLVTGILFRLVFLIAIPNLSQDFYRFIWDGELINQGINPYLYTPNQIIEKSTIIIANSQELYDGMGSLSAKHYSNYPPINQLIFSISSFLGMGSILGSVIWMRVIIILSDIGTVYFGRRLLQNLNQSPHLIFWYFLNPLIIIELTGNLHFEGVMFFLFIWAVHLISKGKYLLAAPIYAASIMLKLVPILFLPLFLPLLGFKKSTFFYVAITVCSILFLIPFYSSEFATHYVQTVRLWFSNFEFNAGFYNLVKTVAVEHYEQKPWEVVKDYGDIVPLLTILIAFLLMVFRDKKSTQSILLSMLVLLSSYYFLSSTVHPWYIVFLVGLSLFTNYRFTLLWSGLVVLSYYAYSQPDFKENLWLLAIEYILVLGFLGYEIMKNHNILAVIRKNN